MMVGDVPSMETIFEFTGSSLCLDFANTMENRQSEEKLKDRVCTYRDLVSWAKQAGSLNSKEAAKLRSLCDQNAAKANQELKSARRLRETIYRIFAAIAANHKPTVEDLELLNRAYAGAVEHSHLAPSNGKFVHQWTWEDDVLSRPLWPVVQDAMELLRSGQAHSVRECAAESCGWLFLDLSRNRSRRWCDMKICGNREKARRHHQRQQA